MPAVAVQACPSGHTIRSSADRDTQGHCRQCMRDNSKRIRVGKEAALMVVRAFEAAGVKFQADGKPAEPAEVARLLGEAWAAGLFD
jgi:hypothetical protein